MDEMTSRDAQSKVQGAQFQLRNGQIQNSGLPNLPVQRLVS
jgi:hypothetical protein